MARGFEQPWRRRRPASEPTPEATAYGRPSSKQRTDCGRWGTGAGGGPPHVVDGMWMPAASSVRRAWSSNPLQLLRLGMLPSNDGRVRPLVVPRSFFQLHFHAVYLTSQPPIRFALPCDLSYQRHVVGHLAHVFRGPFISISPIVLLQVREHPFQIVLEQRELLLDAFVDALPTIGLDVLRVLRIQSFYTFLELLRVLDVVRAAVEFGLEPSYQRLLVPNDPSTLQYRLLRAIYLST